MESIPFISAISAPATNAFSPLPVKMRTLSSECAFISWMPIWISLRVSMFKALSALGRFIVRIPISPSNDNKIFLYSIVPPNQFGVCSDEFGVFNSFLLLRTTNSELSTSFHNHGHALPPSNAECGKTEIDLPPFHLMKERNHQPCP